MAEPLPRSASGAASRDRAWWRPRTGRIDLVVAADLVIAFIVFAADDAWLVAQHNRRPGELLLFVAFITAAPLVLRDRRPLAAWIYSIVAITLSATIVVPRHDIPTPYIPGALVVFALCQYAVAVRGGNRVMITAAVVTVVGAASLDAGSAVISLPAMIPLIIGHLVRLRRATRQALAEQEARHEAETAALEERQRIARELHDVVAHHMSVIAIQAEAAPYKVTDAPPELAESFADIRSAALEGLTELRRILGVLRTEDAPQTAPQPGVERLEEVIASARHGGLAVEVTVAGEAPDLPQGLALSAHRILQEALSNAMKHAAGARVMVAITYAPSELRLSVTNGPGTNPRAVADSGGGHGLVGMRERVHMLGGHLATGPEPGGGFAVTAVLPIPEATS